MWGDQPAPSGGCGCPRMTLHMQVEHCPSDAPVIPKGDWSSQLPNTFSLLCITHHYDHLMGADHCATRRSLLRPPLPSPPPSPHPSPLRTLSPLAPLLASVIGPRADFNSADGLRGGAGGVCEAGDAAGARSVPGCLARRAHVVRSASSLVCDVAINMAVSNVSATAFS